MKKCCNESTFFLLRERTTCGWQKLLKHPGKRCESNDSGYYQIYQTFQGRTQLLDSFLGLPDFHFHIS